MSLLQWDIRQLGAAAAFGISLGSHPLLGVTAISRTQENLKNHFLLLYLTFPSTDLVASVYFFKKGLLLLYLAQINSPA